MPKKARKKQPKRVQIIRTETQYELALEELDSLLNAPVGSEAAERAAFLERLINEYEESAEVEYRLGYRLFE